MKILRKISTVPVIVAFLTLFVSCDKEFDSQPVMQSNTTEALVRLSINTPQPVTPKTMTRSGVDIENTIGNISILVFGQSEGTYKFRYMVPIVSEGSQTTSFSALLKTSSEATKIMLIANAAEVVEANAIAYGQSEAEVKATMVAEFGGKLSSNLPMWGEAVLPEGLTANGANVSVTMLRSVARVDVVKKLAEDSYNFDIQSVHLFRSNDKIQIIPNSVEVDKLQVSAPSLPGNANFNAAQVTYTEKTDEGSGIQAIRKIYLPEASSNAENKLTGVMSVIIGGYFNDEPVLSYYRADFDPGVAGHPYGQVLRNHRYTFNIVKVLGRGWSTPEEAASNRSTNVTVDIESWNDFVTDMVFDGESHFGVSSRTVKHGPNLGSTIVLDISTNINSYTMEWADEFGNGQGAALGLGSAMANGVFSVSLAENGKSMRFYAQTSNVGGTGPLKGYVLLRANRFEILISIEQDFRNSATPPLKVLSVRSNLGYLGSNIPGSITAAEARARGLRGILSNEANFGSLGTVATSGVLLTEVPEISANALTPLYLSQFDVIYLPLIASQAVVNATTAKMITDWLADSDHRFLIVANDLQDYNKNILDALGITGRSWYISGTGAYRLADLEPIAYFISKGPFTMQHYTTIPESFTFRKYDIYHSEISIIDNPEFTPILIGQGNNMVLGINTSRRVLFVGDIDIFNPDAGAGATSDNRLTNSTGDLNNNASLLIANIWGYIAQTVFGK